MFLLRPFFAVALLVFLLPAESAAQTCTPLTISWPEGAAEPIWEMTALPPSLSTGTDGSGLEIRDVKYRGISVLKRGHIPMINVRYEAGCGCFRDWMRNNQRFDADNQTGTCFAQPAPGTSHTVCDEGIGVGDVGSFQGIALEDFGDGFSLITQSLAGWYRYRVSWTFEADGTIRPEIGFSHTPSSCATNPRRHHAYWRLDFDIDSADNNYAAVSRNGDAFEVIEVETTQFWDEPGTTFLPTVWGVFNPDSERGYTLTPGQREYLTPANPGTGNPVIDDFAKEDIAFSRYRPGQLHDHRPGCSVDFHGGTTPIVQGENITSADLVVWYRTGATRLGGNEPNTQDQCIPLGPVLRPVGDWGQPVGSEEGATPTTIALEAFPNPFDQSTTVRFTLDEAQDVRVALFDGLGREVRQIYEGPAAAGASRELTIDGAGLPNGIYTVRVTGESGAAATTRIVLVR